VQDRDQIEILSLAMALFCELAFHEKENDELD